MKNPQPMDLNTTLVQLTESLNKMDFTQKPYKPTIYPTEEEEEEVEEDDSKEGDFRK